MARDLHEDLIANLTSDMVRIVYGVVITLPHPTENYNEDHALWTLDYDRSSYVQSEGVSYAFKGAGDLLSISEASETSDLSANGLSISLMASTDIITVLRDRQYQGLPVKGFIGAVDVNDWTNNLSPTLFKFFDGFADQMLFSMTENAVIVTLKAENKLVRLSKSSGRYYTQEDHLAEYPDDKGFEYMNNLQDREVLWGRK